ncbi:MAG: ComEA family DNA-binding protein [Pseudonocardia sp.]|nr:ComEA family DNA-binding protein [Pseudonocardia sp.]
MLVAAVAAVVAAVGVWTARPQAEAVRGLPGVVVGGTAEAAGGAGGTERTRGTAGGGVAGDGAGPGGGAADGAAGAAAGSAGAGSENAPGGVLVVSVSGRVAHPGVVRVPVGSRVADALTAAGGPQPGTDLTGLNLARRVVDGEQIAVGVPPAPDAAGQPPAGSAAGAGPAGTGGGPAAPAGKVDLNTATLAQLDALPGVGPVTAQHIVEWRTRNGRFARVDQLREIDGIGERRYQQLRGLVMV